MSESKAADGGKATEFEPVADIDPQEPEETESRVLARANDVLPRHIHLLPVAARPFFPGQAVPLVMDAGALAIDHGRRRRDRAQDPRRHPGGG